MQTEQNHEMVVNAANILLPNTSTTPITAMGPLPAPQAPKKPKTKPLECFKPTVHKPDDKAMSKAPKSMLDTLSRAGVRICPSKKKETKTPPPPRKLLVAIVDGSTDDTIHKYVPVRLLMQISSKATEVLEPRPWAGRFKVYGKYDRPALRSVINAIIHREKIPVHTDNTKYSLMANLLTYEACLRVGISSTHSSVKALLKTICSQIAKSAITSDILQLVTYRLGPSDAVFKHTANVLCYQRFKKSIQDISSFEKMVAKKPAMQNAMKQIDQSHKVRREAINASKRNTTHNNGEAGEVNEARGPALTEVVETRVGIAEEQKEALLELLREGGGGGEVSKVE